MSRADMNELSIFNNPEFGQIRMIEYEGKAFAVGNDVARALEYARPHKAVSDHCKGALTRSLPTKGGLQDMKIIPEGDIVRMIVKAADQSQSLAIKEKAERFERWIFDEVIPSVIKTGSYSAVNAQDPALLRAQAMIKNAETRAKNADTNQAKFLVSLTDKFNLSPEAEELVAIQAVEICTKTPFALRPKLSESKYYTATELAKECGCTATRIGLVANKHGLKIAEYGITVLDKSRNSSKQVETFRYNEAGRKRIMDLLGQKAQ